MLSFHVKFVQTDRRTDGLTDRQTDNGKTICPRSSILGHKYMDTINQRSDYTFCAV